MCKVLHQASTLIWITIWTINSDRSTKRVAYLAKIKKYLSAKENVTKQRLNFRLTITIRLLNILMHIHIQFSSQKFNC